MFILNRLLNQRSFFSANAIKIADFIIDNSHAIHRLTSQNLANKIGVSQSSIIKFTQKLGYKGFTDFKQAIIEEHVKKGSILNSKKPIHSKINDQDSPITVAQKLVQEKQNSLISTTNAINFQHFAEVINLIKKASRVQIMGIGGSALTAKDLSYKLLKIGISALAEQDTHIQIATANTLGKGDVQIIISYSGKRKEILVATQAALNKGAYVIALTSPKPSPLRKLATYNIDTIADEDKYRSSSISSRTAQNVIIDLIFISLLQQKEKLKLLMNDISRSIDQL